MPHNPSIRHQNNHLLKLALLDVIMPTPDGVYEQVDDLSMGSLTTSYLTLLSDPIIQNEVVCNLVQSLACQRQEIEMKE